MSKKVCSNGRDSMDVDSCKTTAIARTSAPAETMTTPGTIGKPTEGIMLATAGSTATS